MRPRTTHHHSSSTTTFLPKDLDSCSHVFIRHDAVRAALQKPYDGPFRVVSRSGTNFKLFVKGKEVTVHINRLKPAFSFIEDDSADVPVQYNDK